jgi:hypothetical protein
LVDTPAGASEDPPMTRPKTLLLVTAVALLGGCKPGPAKVCDKINELAVKASVDGDETSKKQAARMQAESATCVSQMQAMEQRDPEEFARATACIEEATEIRGVVQCFFKATMDKTEGKAEAKKE